MFTIGNSTSFLFNTQEHYRQCDTLIHVDNIIFFTDVQRTKDSYLEVFSQNICKFIPKEFFIFEIKMILTTFNQTANGWISYIKEIFYSVPQVESIFYTIDDTDIDVWLIIPKRDFELLRRLVDLEISVLDVFFSEDSSLYRFEFHILYRNDADEYQIVPKKALRLPK